MKKLIFSGLLIALTYVGNAQNAPDKLLQETYKKAKETSDKDITNEKAKLKAKTWLARAQAYEDIAVYYLSLDSNAALTARDAYTKAIELDTKDGKIGATAKDAKAGLGGDRMFNAFMQTGAGKYANKNYGGAQSAFKAASDIHPKDTTATMYTGVAAQLNKDDAVMVDAYEKHLVLGGKDPVIFYSLYLAYSNAKESDKAMAVLNKGIEANPTNKDLKAERTNYYLNSGNEDEAIKSLKEMVEKEPTNIPNIVNLGILHDNNASKLTNEIRKLKESIVSGSDLQNKIDAKSTQVQAYTDERNRLKDLMKKQPKNTDNKRRLGEAETFLSEQTAVLEKLKEDKKVEDAKKVNQAEVQKKVDELSAKQLSFRTDAIGFYKKALAIEPKNYDALYNMGVMEFNEAVEFKRPYDNANPTTEDFKNNGKAMEAKFINKFKDALGFFETAWSVKKDADLKDNLIQVYRILKMEDKLKALGE